MADDEVDGGPIPERMRYAVYARDNLCCRMCGKHVEGDFGAGVHHIEFGGTGRRRKHAVEVMVLLCGRCHRAAHSQKLRWQPLLREAIKRPGITALQLERWQKRGRTRRTSVRIDRSRDH